jgi:photosystem II stability/assembly factor-like uncharacterized protein
MKKETLFSKTLHFVMAVAVIAGAGFVPASSVLAEDAPPAVTSIEPAQAANDVDTPVSISGSGFLNVAGDVQVFLGDQPLANVNVTGDTALTAVAGWGMDPGVYDLRVVFADDSAVTLENAFTVTNGIGEWNTNAIDGGPVRNVLAVESVEGLLYASSSVTSGIFRSLDYGAHWTTVGHAGGEYFRSDPFDANTLYMNTLKSTDGGATWTDLMNGYDWPGTDGWPGGNTQIFPDPAQSGRLYLAAARLNGFESEATGLLRSTDGGQTWTLVTSGFGTDTSVTALEFGSGVLYLGTLAGNLYQSTDAGDTWTQIGSAPALESIGVITLSPFDANSLWITTHYQATAQAKMALVHLDEDPIRVEEKSNWPADQYVRSLFLTGADTLYAATNWDHAWRSTDGGESWNTFNPGDGKPGYSLAIDPWDESQQTFYIADERYGIQKTSNGGASWEVSNSGLHAMSPNFIKVDVQNPSRVYSKIVENGWPGIFVSDDGAQSWNFSPLEPEGSDHTPITSMLGINAGRVFAGAHGYTDGKMGPQLYYSDTQGASWTSVNIAAVSGYEDSFHMPWTLEVDPFEPDTLVMTAVIGNRDLTSDEYVSEVYRSMDNGLTWQGVGLAAQVGTINNLGYLAFDPVNAGVMYAAGDYAILKSTDHGLTWTVLVSGEQYMLGGPIAVEPVAPFRVFIGGQVSADGGDTWNGFDFPINPQQIVFVPGTDTMYVGGTGLYVSNNGGETFRAIDGPLAQLQINALTIVKIDERVILYAGTPGGEADSSAPTGMQIKTQSNQVLEAGVYRLTEIQHFIYLPVIKH